MKGCHFLGANTRGLGPGAMIEMLKQKLQQHSPPPTRMQICSLLTLYVAQLETLVRLCLQPQKIFKWEWFPRLPTDKCHMLVISNGGTMILS